MFDTEQANCLGVDPELFFPTGSINPQTEKILRRICVSCSVWRDCHDYAMNYRVHGFWAGTTYQHREQLRKELGITAKRIDEQYEKQIKHERAEERMREAG